MIIDRVSYGMLEEQTRSDSSETVRASKLRWFGHAQRRDAGYSKKDAGDDSEMCKREMLRRYIRKRILEIELPRKRKREEVCGFGIGEYAGVDLTEEDADGDK